MNFYNAVNNNLNTYPRMTKQDLYKLAYQAAFGCGHLLVDLQQAKVTFESEWAVATPIESKCNWDEIGDMYTRMNLNGASSLPFGTEEAFRTFAASAIHAPQGNLSENLNQLMLMAKNQEIPFSPDTLRDYFAEQSKQGFPAVHHSSIYRNAYQPHYRVVRSEVLRYLPLIVRIFELEKKNQPILLAIDGNSGAGKSTLGSFLADLFHANLFHMDDFFLQPAQKTPQRLAQPGGNVDIERYTAEVLEPILRGISFEYRPYSCQQGMLLDPIQVKQSLISIVEGSYSLHPLVQKTYTLRVFLSADERKQQNRILQRNGPAMWQKFHNVWIPLENRYFDSCHVKETADFVFEV